MIRIWADKSKGIIQLRLIGGSAYFGSPPIKDVEVVVAHIKGLLTSVGISHRIIKEKSDNSEDPRTSLFIIRVEGEEQEQTRQPQDPYSCW